MKKNILYSALLSLLLLMPGQTFCAEQPSFPKDILARMWFSMPTAPGWMTNFTTNLTSGLLDTKKYLLYGGGVFLAVLLGYIGYKAAFSSSDDSSDFFIFPFDLDTLDSPNNYSNIGHILRDYNLQSGDKKREQNFKRYVCQVFK